ncbi:MAG TPA: hypothetical protein VH475_12650 [Tepidisphaeraceae bacterium]|jgi:hypothetical protein
MPKEAKKKHTTATAESRRASRKDGDGPVVERHPVRSFLKSVVLLTFVGLCVYGYLRARDHVVKDITFRPVPPRVVLKERPAWMSDSLANKILRVAAPDVAHSVFDHGLLVNTASLLRNHPDSAPWVRSVKSVRRTYDAAPGDVLEVDCEFRAPVALVRWEAYYWLIDGDGILLPEQYTAGDLRKVMYDGDHVSLRIIEGVMQPPPESGQKWQGADLASGIDMVKLLHGKTYADEVERIDVANFGGRVDAREAQLVLITRYQTQVRWGRPINAKDYFVEVAPAQKLEYMSKIMQQFGRVDAHHSAIDLRFDRVTYPSADAQGDQANTGS